MYMPLVNASGDSARRQIVAFGGLDRTQERREGALTDSVGLSSREWPCLAQRGGRHVARTVFPPPSDIFTWDKLVMVVGTQLFYDGAVMGTLTPGRKQFAVVNTKLCIFPDKKYLDLTARAMGDLQAATVNPQGLEATFGERSITLTAEAPLGTIGSGGDFLRPQERWVRTLKNKRDVGYSFYFKVFDRLDWDAQAGRWQQTLADAEEIWAPSAERLEDMVGKKVWLRDTGIQGGYAMNLKTVREEVYISADDRFLIDRTVTEDYGPYNTQGLYGIITGVKSTDISGNYGPGYSARTIVFQLELHDAARGNPDLSECFAPGDRVSVRGCETFPENDRENLRVESVEGRTITFTLGEDALFTPGVETGAVELRREVPDLDFVCAVGNRLFGVNRAENRVYASALGRPENFYAYDGLPTDSYVQDVGSAGAFTGCVAYGGGALFFKEDCLYKLMGSTPANFALYAYQAAGLQAGSERSLATLNDVLYYKARDGVYAYTGSTPRLVSGDLGETAYQNAVAGSDGRRYYISMERADTGVWELLVYDTRAGLWLREENRRVAAFAKWNGRLYMLTAGESGILALEQGDGDQWSTGGEEHPIPWEATFTPFLEGRLERKYPVRLVLRLELAEGAWAEAELSRDGGPFRHIWTGKAGQGRTVILPIRPGRCDSYQLRLHGEGRCLVRTLEREFTKGGRF